MAFLLHDTYHYNLSRKISFRCDYPVNVGIHGDGKEHCRANGLRAEFLLQFFSGSD